MHPFLRLQEGDLNINLPQFKVHVWSRAYALGNISTFWLSISTMGHCRHGSVSRGSSSCLSAVQSEAKSGIAIAFGVRQYVVRTF